MSFLMWPGQMWTLATHKHTKTHTHTKARRCSRMMTN